MGNKIQFINAISYLWCPACRAVCLCLSSGASIRCVFIYFVLLLSEQLDKGLGKRLSLLLALSLSFARSGAKWRDGVQRRVCHDIKECLRSISRDPYVLFLIVRQLEIKSGDPSQSVEPFRPNQTTDPLHQPVWLRQKPGNPGAVLMSIYS